MVEYQNQGFTFSCLKALFFCQEINTQDLKKGYNTGLSQEVENPLNMMKRKIILVAGFILPLGVSAVIFANNTFLYALAAFFATQFIILLGLSMSTTTQRKNKNKGGEET